MFSKSTSVIVDNIYIKES